MGIFDIFRRKKDRREEDTILINDKTLEKAIEEVIDKPEIAHKITENIKEKATEKLSMEKQILDYDEMIDIISESIGDVYSFEITNRLDVCEQIDKFISENPEVFNSIRIYASYICYGSALHKLEQYRPIFVSNNEDSVKKAESVINKFEKRSKIRKLVYMIAKDVVTYGDAFIEKIKDQQGRIVSVGYLPSKDIVIITDNFGNVVKIVQFLSEGKYNITDVIDKIERGIDFSEEKGKVAIFDRKEFIHFSDGTIAGATDNPIINLLFLWKAIKILEQSMIIYKISRARRMVVFFVDVSGKAPEEVKKFIRKFTNKLRQIFKANINEGVIYGKNASVSIGEDIVIPIRKDSKTKVETIPADTSAKFIDDILPYHKRLLHNLLTAWVLSPDKTGKEEQEKEAFLRIVRTFQSHIADALAELYTDVLRSYGIKDVDVYIEFPSPDVEEEIRMIDTILRRVMVINQIIAVLGVVPPRDWIIKYVFKDLTKNEIKELIQKIEIEIKKTQEEALGTETIFNDITSTEEPQEGDNQEEGNNVVENMNDISKIFQSFDIVMGENNNEDVESVKTNKMTKSSDFIERNKEVLDMMSMYMELMKKMKKKG